MSQPPQLSEGCRGRERKAECGNPLPPGAYDRNDRLSRLRTLALPSALLPTGTRKAFLLPHGEVGGGGGNVSVSPGGGPRMQRPSVQQASLEHLLYAGSY